jgi:hypothetical protein
MSKWQAVSVEVIIRVREGQTNKHDTLIAETDGSFVLSTHPRLPSRGKAPGSGEDLGKFGQELPF